MIRLKWSARKNGAIEWTQNKTGEPVWIPEPAALKTILDSAEKESVFIVVGERTRKPYTENGFYSRFAKLIRRLVSEGKVGKGLTYHGLRSTAAVNLAEAGCDPHTIMAVTGHKTLAMVQHYTEEVNRKTKAKTAIEKLDNHRQKSFTKGPK